jgi:transposase-like protein
MLALCHDFVYHKIYSSCVLIVNALFTFSSINFICFLCTHIIIVLVTDTMAHEDCSSCTHSLLAAAQLSMKNDKDLIEFFQSHGLLRRERRCPTCSDLCTLNINSKAFKCRKVLCVSDKENKKKFRFQCEFSETIFKGTWFQGCKVKMQDLLWFTVIWLNFDLARTERLQTELNLSLTTIHEWCVLHRAVCSNWARRDEGRKLCGEVEIDEFRVADKKHLVVAMIERNTRRGFVVPVSDTKVETIADLCLKWVEPESKILSCKEKLCNQLDNLVFSNKSLQMKRFWRDLEMAIPRKGKKHFCAFIDEFRWKREHRDMRKLLHHFLVEAALLYPLNV